MAGIPVLNYHAIDDTSNINSSHNVSVSLESFRQQMRWLHEDGYKSVSQQDLAGLLEQGRKIPGKNVLITFDDGYYSLYKYAREIMGEYGFTATLFLSTSFIGKTYDQADFGFVSHDRQLNWQEIKDLAADGWCIQSHGYKHLRLAYEKPEVIKQEVVLSKQIIEQNLGSVVNAFAFPYGIYNKQVIDILQDAGYTSAYTVHSGKLYPGRNKFLLPRIEINNSDTFDTYKKKVTTGYISTGSAVRAKIRDLFFANPAMKDAVEKWLHRANIGNR